MSDRPVESDEFQRFDFLAQHGQRLLDNGYHIVPIRIGKKAPGFDGWEKSKPTREQLKEWMDSGHGKGGVGIMAKNTPAIDIDVRDKDIAAKLVAFLQARFGNKLCLRVGDAPKVLIPFRTDAPFRKMRSTVRKDEFGQKQQVEILGEGQQFVAYHKHPGTGKPYQWTLKGKNPLTVRAHDLPTLSMDDIQAVLDEFERLANEEEWTVEHAARSNAKGSSGDDNPFVEDTAPVDMSDGEIRARLMLVPGVEDYDTWSQIGMALYHQWDGDEKGKDYWHEWSETADNYDADALERKWETFAIGGKRRAPVTVRYILKLSAEAVLNANAKLGLELRQKFTEAKTEVEWDKAAKEAQKAEISVLERSALAHTAKDARDRVTGSKTPLLEIKKAIAYTPESPKLENAPPWVRKNVYDVSTDRFVDIEAKTTATVQGFNAMHDRHAMTKKDILDGKSSPSSSAAALALNFYKIKTVDGQRYSPGDDPVYYDLQGVFVNTYRENEIPEITQWLPRDKRNLKFVKDHYVHLLPNPKERRMLIDWLSWVVQNPGRHANWSIVLQGVEGDGKSFIGEKMRRVMGLSNVRMVNAHIFHSDFTDWSVGQCLICVEEIRLVGEKKYETLNKIKPNIANHILEVHPKGKAPYNAKNTTSYLMFSNFKDALPIDDDARRFAILYSVWQSRVKLAAFKDENPDYYVNLYNAIEESPGIIREWLLNHEQSEDFNALGDAPMTAARQFMIRQAKSEFIVALEDHIAENKSFHADEKLVDLTATVMELREVGIEIPAPKSLGTMMMRAGYEELGQVKLGGGIRSTFYSKSPELFRHAVAQGEFTTDVMKIKKHVSARKADLDEL